MNLTKRIKNLWKLSEIEVPKEKMEQITNIIKQEQPKLAQIIKRTTPVEEFLKENE